MYPEPDAATAALDKYLDEQEEADREDDDDE